MSKIIFLTSNLSFFISGYYLYKQKNNIEASISILSGITALYNHYNQCIQTDCNFGDYNEYKIDFVYALLLSLFFMYSAKYSHASMLLIVSTLIQILSIGSSLQYRLIHSIWHIFISYMLLSI